MNLIKLSIKNSRSQFKNFLMYFVSMAFGVMVYYSFIAISHDQALLTEIQKNNNLASTLRAASMMIFLFILVFMFAANGFFLKRRKPEIALYNLLGMRKYQIGALFFIENMVIGIGSLIVGVIGGIILSKLFSMILIKVMFLSIDNHFTVSFVAVKQTALMFMAILAVVSLRSGYVIYRYKLIELMEAKRQGDRYLHNRILTLMTGLVGIACLTYGYYQASHLVDYSLFLTEKTASDMAFILAIFIILFICIIGSYLIFYGFLPLLLALLQSNKAYYYRDIRLVSVGNLRFHMRKNAATLGTIAVLLGTALAAIGGATDVYSFGMESVTNETPTDYIVNTPDYPELVELIGELPGYQVGAPFELSMKVTGGHYMMTSFEQIDDPYTGAVSLLSLSNYRQLQKYNSNLESIELTSPDQVVVFEKTLSSNALAERSVIQELYLQPLAHPLVVTEIRGGNIGGGYSSRYAIPVLVIADQLYRTISTDIEYSLTLVDIKDGQDSQELSDHLSAKFKQKEYYLPVAIRFLDQQVSGVIGPEQPFDQTIEREQKLIREVLTTRYPALKENQIRFGLLIYTAVFLGIVFFIATGSMIMLKQLSEAEEERDRYQMLRKIGVSQKLIRRSIYKQNFLVFFVPLVVAVLHSIFALKALGFLIGSNNGGLTWAARVIFVIIYLSFYLSTSATYNRLVND